MKEVSISILERIAKNRDIKVYVILDEIIEDELRKIRDRKKLTKIKK